MSPRLRRAVFWAVPGIVLALALAAAFRPRAVEVDVVTVVEGPLTVTVAEDGRTRIRDLYVVSAPVRGRALRIDIEEGDPVTAGETVVARIEPTDPAFLDVRSEAEARVGVETAKAALALSEARLAEARAELDFAEAEVRRVRRLRESGTVPERALEEAERALATRRAAVETARAAIAMRRSELEAARVRLRRPDEAGGEGCPCLPIRAPVSGQVLRVLHESEGVVSAGEPLVEIGNPGELEVVADFLSSDAVRIEPGQRVLLERWGGDGALAGEVERVEPYGFTKVSALGIEESRVNVVIRFTGPPGRRARLGHGFELEARVVLWEAARVTKVPLTALFREGTDWAVFTVEDGRAAIRRVELGPRTDLEAAVQAGLAPGERVLRYPHDAIEPGSRVAPR